MDKKSNIIRPSLSELAQKYGADKAPSALKEFREKHGSHRRGWLHDYTDRYEFFFNPIRDEVRKVLEIGVRYGYSVNMWRDYFPRAHIIGIDNRGSCKRSEDARITVHIGDQGDSNFLNKVAEKHGPFDIIIDDGSHKNEHQILGFKTLFQYMKPRGYYVVEDLWFSYGEIHEQQDSVEMSKKPPLQNSFVIYLRELIDRINLHGWPRPPCGNRYFELENAVAKGMELDEMDEHILAMHLSTYLAIIQHM